MAKPTRHAVTKADGKFAMDLLKRFDSVYIERAWGDNTYPQLPTPCILKAIDGCDIDPSKDINYVASKLTMDVHMLDVVHIKHIPTCSKEFFTIHSATYVKRGAGGEETLEQPKLHRENVYKDYCIYLPAREITVKCSTAKTVELVHIKNGEEKKYTDSLFFNVKYGRSMWKLTQKPRTCTHVRVDGKLKRIKFGEHPVTLKICEPKAFDHWTTEPKPANPESANTNTLHGAKERESRKRRHEPLNGWRKSKRLRQRVPITMLQVC